MWYFFQVVSRRSDEGKGVKQTPAAANYAPFGPISIL